MTLRYGRRLLVMALAIRAFAVMSDVVYAEAFPSDEILLNSFRTHSVAYERLRDMATEDMNTQSTFTVGYLSAALPKARREEYRSLMSSITPDLMVGVDYNGIVRFIFVLHGSAIGPSSLKGIEYVPAGARSGALFVHDLNKLERYTDGVYLRPIKSGWFVLYQSTN